MYSLLLQRVWKHKPLATTMNWYKGLFMIKANAKTDLDNSQLKLTIVKQECTHWNGSKEMCFVCLCHWQE